MRDYIKERNKEIYSENVADLQECFENLTEIMRDETSTKTEKLKAIDLRLKTLGAYLDRKEIDLKTTINVSLED